MGDDVAVACVDSYGTPTPLVGRYLSIQIMGNTSDAVSTTVASENYAVANVLTLCEVKVCPLSSCICGDSVYPALLVTPFAGSGTCGYSGDGSAYGSGTQLNNLGYLTLDSHGNVVVADYGNNKVRLLNATSGIITSIASATNPYQAVYDPSGNLYISELFGSLVLRVSPSGTVSTFAGTGSGGSSGDGGQATAAQLYWPDSLAYYQGSIYIADNGACCIRKVVLSTNIISTVVGTCGTCSFSGDGGLAISARLNKLSFILFDGTGNMFISEQVNYRIRKVNTTGYISTIAGNGSITVSGDNGLAVNAGIGPPFQLAFDAFGDLYIAGDSNVIRKVSMSSGIISTIAGTGAATDTGDGGSALGASFNLPRGIIFDMAGDLIVSEFNGEAIKDSLFFAETYSCHRACRLPHSKDIRCLSSLPCRIIRHWLGMPSVPRRTDFGDWICLLHSILPSALAPSPSSAFKHHHHLRRHR